MASKWNHLQHLRAVNSVWFNCAKWTILYVGLRQKFEHMHKLHSLRGFDRQFLKVRHLITLYPRSRSTIIDDSKSTYTTNSRLLSLINGETDFVRWPAQKCLPLEWFHSSFALTLSHNNTYNIIPTKLLYVMWRKLLIFAHSESTKLIIDKLKTVMHVQWIATLICVIVSRLNYLYAYLLA